MSGIDGDKMALSVEEAARRASVSINTVRRWIVAGDLRGKKVGGRLLILRADLAAFLERQPDAVLTSA